MKVLDRKRVVDFWKDVVVGLFPWAIFCVCFNMIPFVRGYLSAMAVWSFFLALLCTRIVNFCLPQQAATDDPKNTLLPPTTWAEMITEALDGTLETARLLRCDSSRGAAKLCKKKVAEKLIGGADPEQLFKELDEQILNGLRRLSEDANQRLEGLKNKFGLDATKLSKTGLAKLSDADCRAALPIALEAAGWLMQCHKANEEVRRLENPLNVKARQCATQLDELNEKFTKAVAELIAVSYNEDESRPNESRIERSPMDCLEQVVNDMKRKAADGKNCNNCSDMETAVHALERTADALRTANERLTEDYDCTLKDRERDKEEMERLTKLVKLHSEKGHKVQEEK